MSPQTRQGLVFVIFTFQKFRLVHKNFFYMFHVLFIQKGQNIVLCHIYEFVPLRSGFRVKRTEKATVTPGDRNGNCGATSGHLLLCWT